MSLPLIGLSTDSRPATAARPTTAARTPARHVSPGAGTTQHTVPALPVHALHELAPDTLADIAAEHGAFILTDHGIRAEVVEGVLDAARLFFALPAAEKDAIASHRSAQFRGWTAFGAGDDEGWREQFDYGAELPAVPAEARRSPDEALVGPNQWPGRVPELRGRALWLQDRTTEVARAVLRQLGVGLGQDGAFFDRALAGDAATWTSVARDGGLAGRSFGTREVQDSALVTLRWLAPRASGLQVRVGHRWVEVPAHDNAFLVTFGERLAEASQGQVAAARHRQLPADGERLALAADFDAPYGLEVPVIGWDHTARPQRGTRA